MTKKAGTKKAITLEKDLNVKDGAKVAGGLNFTKIEYRYT